MTAHHPEKPFEEPCDLSFRKLICLGNNDIGIFTVILEIFKLLLDHSVTVGQEIFVWERASFDKLLLEVLIKGLFEVGPLHDLR